MGAAMCIPAALPDVPYLDPLPPGIVQLTESSPPERILEFKKLLVESFAGTTETAPEASLSWALEPHASVNNNPAAPLKQPPSPVRLKYMDTVISFALYSHLRHGGCYALTENDDGTGHIVGATITMPPNDDTLHDPGCCEMIHVVKRMGGTEAISPEMSTGLSQERTDAIGELMKEAHATHAPCRHIYVYTFAIASGTQGKGYGRKLMEFITSAADDMGVDAYLECSGLRNERFYNHNGYKVMQHYTVEVDGLKFDPEGTGGLAAMVREPRTRAFEQHNAAP